MATIRERVNGGRTTFTVQFRHEGKQRGPTYGTRAKAEQLLAMIEASGTQRAVDEIERQNVERKKAALSPTVTQMLERHVKTITGVTDGTRSTYEMITRQIAATPLGKLPIDRVTRDDVAAWIREQEESEASSKTIKNRQGLLSAAFKRAMLDDQITKNPAVAVRIARTERREMTFLTPDEFQILLNRIPTYYQPFITFLYGTGLRFGEAIALRIQDVHLDDSPPTLTVSRAWKMGGGYGPPKTARGRRTISLPTYAVDAVRTAAGDRGPAELVFVNQRGERIDRHTMYGNWLTWIDDTKKGPPGEGRVPRLPVIGKRPRIHDLRHSHASWMLARGFNLHSLAQRLGHESIQTTSDTYGHLLPEAQIQAVRAANLALVAIPEPLAIQAGTSCAHDLAVNAGTPFCGECGTRMSQE